MPTMVEPFVTKLCGLLETGIREQGVLYQSNENES